MSKLETSARQDFKFPIGECECVCDGAEMQVPQDTALGMGKGHCCVLWSEEQWDGWGASSTRHRHGTTGP